MKNIFFILLMIFGNQIYAQQTHTIAFGSQGYVTIDGQNYKRGDLRSQYNYLPADSTLAILYANTRIYLINPTVDSNYLYADSANKRAYNILILRTWMNTNFEYLH